MSSSIASWLTEHGIIKEKGHAKVWLAFSDACKNVKHKIDYKLSLQNEMNSITQITNKATMLSLRVTST
jgi:hypothetical protein